VNEIARMCIYVDGAYLNIGSLYSDGDWCVARIRKKPSATIKWIANANDSDSAPMLTGVLVSYSGEECGCMDTSDNHVGKVQYYGYLYPFGGEGAAKLTRLETTYELVEWQKDRGIYQHHDRKVQLLKGFS